MDRRRGKPFVVNNTGHIEWFTPKQYIDAVKEVMGYIDLDPASCDEANIIVRAKQYFTKEENGLTQNWFGRVFMNPPYSQRLVSKFASKLIEELISGNTKEAIVLVNNATETEWFQNMLEHSDAICLIKGRIKFVNEKGAVMGTPLQGQVFLYFGGNVSKFCKVFGKLGKTFVPIVRGERKNEPKKI